MKYAIVIVTYNRVELLKECISCAINQSYPAKKIVIVDNHSTDGTPNYLNDNYITDGRFIIYLENENMGGAAGFCRGLQLAMESNNDWIMLIDDDAMLDNQCMQKIFEGMEKVESQAYACAVWSNGEIDTLHRRNISKPISKIEYDKSYFNCSMASFCGLLISNNLVKMIGYPKAEYFIWNDDLEYSLRISKIAKIVVFPKAILDHRSIMSINKSSNSLTWKNYYGIRNSIDTQIEHHLYKILIINLLHLLKRTLCAFISYKKMKYEAHLYCNAIFDGFTKKLGKNQKYLPKY